MNEENFKLSFMRDNNPQGQANKAETESAENYPTGGSARNLCFVHADNSRIFLNYAYLVAGEFTPDGNVITLTFTTHLITLKGIRLETLFDALMHHAPKIITATDMRYNATADETAAVVNEIIVVGNV